MSVGIFGIIYRSVVLLLAWIKRRSLYQVNIGIPLRLVYIIVFVCILELFYS